MVSDMALHHSLRPASDWERKKKACLKNNPNMNLKLAVNVWGYSYIVHNLTIVPSICDELTP